MADLALGKEFEAASKFAWEVYKSCQDAGWAFDDVARAVIALHSKLHTFTLEASSPTWPLRLLPSDLQTYTSLPTSSLATLRTVSTTLTTYKSQHIHRSSRREWLSNTTTQNTLSMKKAVVAETTKLSMFLGRLKEVGGRSERRSYRKELVDDKKGKLFDAPANMAVGIDEVNGSGGEGSAKAVWMDLLRKQNLDVVKGGGEKVVVKEVVKEVDHKEVLERFVSGQQQQQVEIQRAQMKAQLGPEALGMAGRGDGIC